MGLLAVVDLGSNSFRLQISRVEKGEIYSVDSFREAVRLAAGLSAENLLDDAAQQRALDALEHIGERLRGSAPDAVRVVGTNALRVAKNSAAFLRKAQQVLGYPVEVISEDEEARLIYLGVAHSQSAPEHRRLVVDIGGGSTELIIGQGFDPTLMQSLHLGCVGYSLRFFPGGEINKQNLRQAEQAARTELLTVSYEFRRAGWDEAVGSSGTIKATAAILELNGLSKRGITLEGLEALRAIMLKAGHSDELKLAGLRPDRTPIIAGGFAILSAVFAEFDLSEMMIAKGALRHGVLHDLLGRAPRNKTRNRAA
ncbi:MAG: exopolyphosphatase [Burkholderiales bacterium]